MNIFIAPLPSRVLDKRILVEVLLSSLKEKRFLPYQLKQEELWDIDTLSSELPMDEVIKVVRD